MRIGLLGTLAKPITLEASGGTEMFCALLSHGLAKKGHEVYLFASRESQVPGVRLIPVSERTMADVREELNHHDRPDFTAELKHNVDLAFNARMAMAALVHEDALDVFHDNTSSLIIGSVSDFLQKPTVTTLHMPPSTFSEYVHVPQLVTKPLNTYVAVSKFEQRHSPVASRVIYNGTEIEQYPFHEAGAEEMIWIGRVSKATPKGLKEALQASALVRKPLLFAGFVSDKPYYDAEIAPLIGPYGRPVGVINDQEKKAAFYGQAKLALFPIQWEEPFGFVFTEAMACGTPLVAFARGSVPEIIEDGVTGYIVNASAEDKRGDWTVKATGMDGIREAIERVYSLSHEQYRAMRRAARERVEQLFTVEAMVNAYEALYQELSGKQ